MLYEARPKAVIDENTRLFSAVKQRDTKTAKNLLDFGDTINKISKITIEKIKGDN